MKREKTGISILMGLVGKYLDTIIKYYFYFDKDKYALFYGMLYP